MSDTAAELTTLYLSEGDRLRRKISRIIGDRALASDLVHDVFLRFWDRKAASDGDPAAYLTRSARNAAIDYLRTERVRADFVAGTVPEQRTVQPASPHDILEARDGLRRVDDVIRALPERTRHVFLLNRIHGCSYGEIAMALGVTGSAVEKHMSRALGAIRVGFEEN